MLKETVSGLGFLAAKNRTSCGSVVLKYVALGFEQSDRLHKVLEYMNAAHELCTLLGMDFTQIIADVHPSLVDSNGGQPKSISNDTIAQLAKTIHSLREEKKLRLQKVWLYSKL
jgi:hypothetical protein